MNRDNFTISIRRFLKEAGVNSHREIEEAVDVAINKGILKGDESLKARMTLTVDDIDLTVVIDGEISLV